MAPAGLGVVNDAIATYFRDAALAASFVARWCRQRSTEAKLDFGHFRNLANKNNGIYIRA